MTLGALRKAVVDGDTVYGSVMAGQSAGLVKKEETCKEIIEDVVGLNNRQYSLLHVIKDTGAPERVAYGILSEIRRNRKWVREYLCFPDRAHSI